MLVQIDASGAPRETLVALLKASRRDRPGGVMLTAEPKEGFYYAQIEHAGVLNTFVGQLNQLTITYSLMESLPGGGTLTPAAKRTTGVFTMGGVPLRQDTVDAFNDAIVNMLKPLRPPFGF